MQPKIKICLAAILLAFVAGCAAITPDPGMTRGPGSQQRDLDCPADLEVYCGGWTVFDSNLDPDVTDPKVHMLKHDEFVIGKKRNGTDPLAIFPRPEALLERWDMQTLIPLRERTKKVNGEDVHDCMVGRVKVKSSSSHPPNQWQQLTVRMDEDKTPEIGIEDTIVICMEHQTGGDWPRECLPGSCREPYDSDPRNHSGRAHAH